ncbi:hypothetical protein ACFQ3J_23670 [Paenibacillus provencensis]|uniref:ABC-2 type transport system permease protein n=1 Tax=Paenibacillus provencensis TaxID=441151 RepID=A0ABW3PYL3_9BACL|nr:hypothetical protein [Paenibacillus sp. MER 78]MCM3130071.1 hypothetical protein [Paenibacillus sp. MER 78]
MLRTLNTILQLQVSSIANRLIYYVQKLPLIGGLVGDTAYSRAGLKRAGAIAALLLSILWGFLASMLYIGLVIYIPVVTLGTDLAPERQLNLFWHIFFIITFIIAGVSSARILEPKRSKYIAVKLLRLPATRYMRATLGYKYITMFVYLLTAVLLFSSLLGAPMVQGIRLTAAAVMWRIACEYFHYWLFRRTGSVLIKNNIVVWTVIFIGYAAAFAPLLFEWAPAWGAPLTSAMLLYVICMLLGVFAGVVLFWRIDYTDAVDAATKRDDPLLDLGRMMADAQQTAVKAKDSDYSQEVLNDSRKSFEKKEGYDYINAIFFSRHKSLIRQPLYKRLVILAALGAALILAGFLYREPMAAAASNIGVLLPGLILIMAYLTVGEQLCKVLFFHCDLKLLRQSFYRQDAAKHFRIRLIKILGMNLLLAAVLAVVLTLATIAAGGLTTAADLVYLWVSAFSLALFFSVHHLFLYYIFQPYTTELNTKNPFFYLFSWIVSSIFVLSISLRPDPAVFSMSTAAIALIYLVAALPLVRKYASRTFRVK